MQNTVAGPIPLAMKVLLLLLETVTQMETMRLEKNRTMNQRKGVVVEERFQGRHLDPGPDLWKRLQDETCVKEKLSLSDQNFVQLSLWCFFVSLIENSVFQKLIYSGLLKRFISSCYDT